MTLPYLLTQKNKYPIGILGLTFSTSLYSFTNQFQFIEPRLLPYGFLNQTIPFVPETIWIYVTHALLFICAYITAKNLENLNKFFYAFLSMQIITCAFFLFFPTVFPRELFPLDQNQMDTFTFMLFDFIHKIDTPANCFPSQHVASVYLASFIFLNDRKKLFPIFFTWATLISISTVTTKQHYITDVPAGALVALFCYWVFYKKVKYTRTLLAA